MKKIICSCLLILFSVSVMCGCSQLDQSSVGAEKTVGIVLPSRYLERWNQDGELLKNKFDAYGFDVTVLYSNNDEKQEKTNVSSLITNGVDLLIIAPVDGYALAEVLTEAKSKNIPVISYDRMIMNTDAVSYHISFDNHYIGVLQGQYIVDALDLAHADGRSYYMEIVGGDQNDDNALKLYEGAMDILWPYMEEGILIVPSNQIAFDQVVTDLWSTEEAQLRMQAILAATYSGDQRLDAVLCANDSTALGVTRAIDEAYRLNNRPIITGQDGDEKNIQNIIDGRQSMTIKKEFSYEAELAVVVGIELLEGRKPDAGLIAEHWFEFDMVYDNELYHNGDTFQPTYLIRSLGVIDRSTFRQN